MYRLLNLLFGWDYIRWTNPCDSGIARVRTSGNDQIIWYWRYKNTRIIDQITRKDQVIWLTCKPEKYFPSSSPATKNIEKAIEITENIKKAIEIKNKIFKLDLIEVKTEKQKKELTELIKEEKELFRHFLDQIDHTNQ